MPMLRVLTLCSLALAQQCAALDDICSRVPEVVSTSVSNQGKFAVWDASLKMLLWVDSPAFTPNWAGSVVYAFDPKESKTHEVISFDTAIVGSIMPRSGGGALLAISESVPGSNMQTSTVRTMDIDPQTLKGSNLQVVATLPADTMGKVNNGNCDPAGRYWVGTFDYGNEKDFKGKVWVLRPDADGNGYSASVGIDNLGHPNGLFWRKNGTELLFSRTWVNTVEKYDYSMAEGKVLGHPTTLVTAPDHELLDSMCGFQDGSFLVAEPDSGQLRYFGADGQSKCVIKVPNIEPSTFVASCAFGGDDLYIPTGRNGGSTTGPAGWLYRIPGVAGGVESNSCNVQAPARSMVV